MVTPVVVVVVVVLVVVVFGSKLVPLLLFVWPRFPSNKNAVGPQVQVNPAAAAAAEEDQVKWMLQVLGLARATRAPAPIRPARGRKEAAKRLQLLLVNNRSR